MDSARRSSGSKDIEWRGTEYWISRGSGRQSETAVWFAAGSPRSRRSSGTFPAQTENLRILRNTHPSRPVRFSVWNSFNPVHVYALRTFLDKFWTVQGAPLFYSLTEYLHWNETAETERELYFRLNFEIVDYCSKFLSNVSFVHSQTLDVMNYINTLSTPESSVWNELTQIQVYWNIW